MVEEWGGEETRQGCWGGRGRGVDGGVEADGKVKGDGSDGGGEDWGWGGGEGIRAKETVIGHSPHQ